MEMVDKAKKDGKIRYVGVTGHADPGVMNRVLERYDFDAVLIPLSVTDGAAEGAKSFEKTTLPLARKQGLGVIAMKTTGVGAILNKKVATLDEALGYVLSLPISTAIMGCDKVAQVEADVRVAANSRSMPESAMDSLRRRASGFELAALEPWKTVV
jgi:predicted aldo/keto reductase-like oxidoreductase